MSGQILHAHSDQQVLIRKRVGDQYGGYWISGVFILLGAVATVLPMLFPSLGSAPVNMIVAFWALILLTSVIFVSQSGPAEIELNGGSESYTLTAGLPLIAKTHHGSIHEIKCVTCRIVPTRGAAAYQIVVEWQDSSRRPTLIRYGRQLEVSTILDEVKIKANLPTRWDDRTK